MLRKIVRSSGPVITVTFGLDLIRSMSWTGTGSIMSISPDKSAATRVASDVLGGKITSGRLCWGLPDQSGFGLKTVLTPGGWLASRNGLVPLAVSAQALSEVA